MGWLTDAELAALQPAEHAAFPGLFDLSRAEAPAREVARDRAGGYVVPRG